MSYPKQLTPSAERIVCLDVLRGVAVLGILVMNIYAFAMPAMAYSNPLVMGGTDPVNLGVWFFTHALFDQKFMTIFSLLFGAGIVLMSDRADARETSFAPTFYRRQFWLLVIGAIHAYLIWFGDILFAYALVGMIVFFFRRMPARKLIVIALFMLPMSPLIFYSSGTQMLELKATAESLQQRVEEGEVLDEIEQATVDQWDEQKPFFAPGPEEIQAEVDAYTSDYATIVAHRAPFVAMFQFAFFLLFTLWRVGGLMLLGMALMKLGVLSGERSPGFYARLLAIGYGLGLPLTIWSGVNLYAHEFDGLYAFQLGGIPNYIGSILVALGHIGAVMYAVKAGWLEGLLRRFGAVGRMALTNYLMHSIVMTSIFYGYGLGLYGEVSRSAQMLFVAAMLAFQIAVSPWWLSRYRFGPAEWLWRSVSYGRLQPMRAR